MFSILQLNSRVDINYGVIENNHCYRTSPELCTGPWTYAPDTIGDMTNSSIHVQCGIKCKMIFTILFIQKDSLIKV